jgi:hypothetical protein
VFNNIYPCSHCSKNSKLTPPTGLPRPAAVEHIQAPERLGASPKSSDGTPAVVTQIIARLAVTAFRGMV